MNEKSNIFNLPAKNLSKESDIIECDNISKVYNLMGRYDKVIALSEISLSKTSEFYPIKNGEFVMIRGPSGGGKTTLLNVIGTIDNATTGELRKKSVISH